MSEDLIDSLKQLNRVRTYTDEQGRFHMTSISEEEEKRRKEEKLGKHICPKCNKRFHWLHNSPDGIRICEDCFKQIWDEKSEYSGYILSYSANCPYCERKIVAHTIDSSGDVKGNCDCGAFYEGFNDYDDRGVYFTFYKKKG